MVETKLKGNLTEMECMIAFIELGYQVSIPFGEDCRYDFIADLNGKLYRIQCKTSSLVYDDNEKPVAIKFKTCRQSGSCSKVYTRTKYTRNEIDFFATSYNKKCYLVPVEECSFEKTLRIVPPKDGRTKGITFLNNQELSEVLKTL